MVEGIGRHKGPERDLAANDLTFRAARDTTVDEIKKFCILDTEASDLLSQAVRNMGLSNRSYLRTLKIARSIADIADSENIKIYHLAEAIQYRKQN